MLFERIETMGLSHFSYVLAEDGEAVVIDPRRDVGVYIDMTLRHGNRIAHVLETHRHEDFIVGSVELAERTGAQIWHADDQEEYRYGTGAKTGQRWEIGNRSLLALATPGHTPGHMSYLLAENDGTPLLLFSGDTLLAGEVGRTDLSGDEVAEEATERLFDSIHSVILPMGDGVVLCPAHGGGSACGASIGDRPWTTLGIERQTNPKLSMQRDEFVKTHAEESRSLPLPPYFANVHELNLRPRVLGRFPLPEPMSAPRFAEAAQQVRVLDVRPVGCFAAAHVPGALSIELADIGQWAGWLLEPEEPFLLVTESADVAEAVRQLVRIGFEEIIGSLAGGGVTGWTTSGMPTASFRSLSARALQEELSAPQGDSRPLVLDVRTAQELEATKPIDGALHIPLRDMPRRINEVPPDHPIVTVCGSGVRSTTAASLLERAGYRDLAVLSGGMGAWTSAT